MAKKFVSKRSETGSKRCVWNGSKIYTKSGYTKKDLVKTESCKIMSRKQFKKAQSFKKSPWMKAVAKARKELGITGFVIMNRGARGTALYKAAKSFM